MKRWNRAKSEKKANRAAKGAAVGTGIPAIAAASIALVRNIFPNLLPWDPEQDRVLIESLLGIAVVMGPVIAHRKVFKEDKEKYEGKVQKINPSGFLILIAAAPFILGGCSLKLTVGPDGARTHEVSVDPDTAVFLAEQAITLIERGEVERDSVEDRIERWLDIADRAGIDIDSLIERLEG